MKSLAAMAVIILTVLVGQIVSTVSFNEKIHTVNGADDKSASYLALANREDSTSSWVK